MKKVTLFAGVAMFLTSCGGGEEMKVDAAGNHVEKTELDRIEESAHEMEEHGAFTAVDFNDGLLAEITLLDVKYQELADMDAMDTTVHAIETSAKASIAEAEKVIASINGFKSVGIGGDHLKQAGVDLAKAFKAYAEAYLTVADIFAVPDAKWTDDQYDRWDKFDLKYNEDFLKAGDIFNDEQQSFFNMNNLVQGEIVNPSEIYKEQKEIEK